MERKRKAGGGRKARGNKPAVHFNTRIDPDDREQLERDAKRNNRTLSQEIQLRLKASIGNPDATDEEEQTSAVCYLVAQIAGRCRPLRSPPAAKVVDQSWHNNRFLFETFKSAVVQMLDRLPVPDGEVEDTKHIDFATPEELAKAIVFGIWGDLTGGFSDWNAQLLNIASGTPFYAYSQAARALGISQKGGKKP